MSDKFLADPIILRREGQKQLEQKKLLDEKINTIYTTLDDMINNDYLAPASRQIASAIIAKKELLLSMSSAIKGYGDFCITAGGNVIENDQNVADNYSRKIDKSVF